MLQTGLCSVSFRGLTQEEVIKAAAAANLEYIEWGSDVHAPCDDLKRLQEIARLQKLYGIACSSYGTYFRVGKDTPEALDSYIRAARILGTDILRLWCGTKGSADYTSRERDQLYDQCRVLADIAQSAGVTLCMECHGGTMTDQAEPAYALMQAVNSPAFQMYYQPSQYRTLEENLAYARLLSPYVRHIHTFHWAGELRFPLREGLAQWKQYLSCFDGSHVLLLEFMPDDRVESLPEEAKALYEMIGGAK